jgi:hypothetical protein
MKQEVGGFAMRRCWHVLRAYVIALLDSEAQTAKMNTPLTETPDELLRWICCPIFAYSAFAAHEKNRGLWVWVFGALAALYNPIFRVEK